MKENWQPNVQNSANATFIGIEKYINGIIHKKEPEDNAVCISIVIAPLPYKVQN